MTPRCLHAITCCSVASASSSAAAATSAAALYNKIYGNLVADKKDLNAERAALEAPLAGRLSPLD